MPPHRAIEIAAERLAPAAQELAAAAGSKLTEFVRSTFSKEGVAGGELLPRRRFLRYDPGASDLDSLPTYADWEMRKPELSLAIADRIEQPRLSQEQFWQPLSSFAQKDRSIVRGILEHSASNATDGGLQRALGSIGNQIEAQFPGQSRQAQLLAASASSPGNMFAYLFRKSLRSDQTTHYLDHSDTANSLGLLDGRSKLINFSPAVIFDDLKLLKSAERTVLKELQAQRPVVAVDVNAFEHTPNFIDFARGQPAVVEKLEGLLKETRDLMGQEPGLAEQEAIKRVLYREFDRSVAAFNGEAPEAMRSVITMRPEPIAPAAAFESPVTPELVTRFLEQEFRNKSGERIMAAELLAENVEFHTLGSLIPKLKNLEEALHQSARDRQLDPNNDIFVIAAESGTGTGSSDAFMTYLYKKATGLSDDRIVTLRQLQELQSQAKLGDKRVVALDDAIYSGEQAQCLLKCDLRTYDKIALATLSSSSRFAERMHKYYMSDSAYVAGEQLRDLVSLQSDFPLGPAPTKGGNPFFHRLTGEEQKLVAKLISPSVGDINELSSLKVFPHMVSDTTVWWLEEFTKKFRVTFGRLDGKRLEQ